MAWPGLATVGLIAISELHHAREWWYPGWAWSPGQSSTTGLTRNILLALAADAGAAAYLGWHWLIGRQLLFWVHGAGSRSRFDEAMALGAGLVLHGLLVAGTGWLGVAHPLTYAMILAAACGYFLRRTPGWPAFERISFSYDGLWLAVAILPALPWLLAAPLLPATEVDMLVYHLGSPQRWILAHRITDLSGTIASYFPLGIEHVVTPLVAFHLLPVATAFQLGLVVATAFTIAAVIDSVTPRVGLLGGCFVACGAPGLKLAAQGHPDAALLFAAALLVVASVRGRPSDWGIAFALALACKLTGAPLAAACALPLLRIGFWRRHRAGALGLILVPPLLAVVGWLARNMYRTGNPVYPFAANLFPSLDWTAWNTGVLGHLLRSGPLATARWTPAGLDGGLWRLTTTASFWPLLILLAAMPYAALRRGGGRPVRLVAIQGMGAAVLLLALLPRDGRYCLPLAVPLGCVGVWLLRDLPRPVMRGSLLCALVLETAAFGRVFHDAAGRPERVLSGALDADHYRHAMLPAYQRAIDDLSAAAHGNGRILLMGGAAGYGLNHPWRGDDVADRPAVLEAVGEVSDPARMAVHMRQGGYRWVMANPIKELPPVRQPALPALPETWLEAYASFWRTHMVLIVPASRFDGMGGWWSYEFRGSVHSNSPQPWLPGAEPFLLKESDLRRRNLDGATFEMEGRLLPDFGVTWYHRALQSYVGEMDEAGTLRNGTAAVLRGVEVPWLLETMSGIELNHRHFPQAAYWAQRTLAINPDSELAAAILLMARPPARGALQ